ncbi:MAG: tetratricopeptide repeat protein [FCB group bacterium]|nr:tetratricopeptide repeat protein [FCB group bacterium]
MKWIVLSVLIVSLLTVFSHAQDNLDSLEESSAAAEGSSKVDLLNELAYACGFIAPEKSIAYSREALELAREIGYEWGIADALNYLAMGYDVLGDYDQALKYYFESLRTFEKFDEYGVSTILNNIGTLYSQMGDYEKALEYYEESRKYFSELDHASMGIYLNNIAEVYSIMGDNVKSLELYYQSREHYEKVDDHDGVATALNNIADVHKVMGDYDKALAAGLESKRIFEERKDMSGKTYALLTLSEISIELKDYSTALHYLQETEVLSQEIGSGDLILTSRENMYKTYRATGDFEKAFEYLKLYSGLKDSLLSQESRSEVATMEFLYETEKKEKEIEILKNVKEQRTTQRNASIISFFAMLAAAVILYRSNRYKNRLNKVLDEKNKNLSRLNNELDTALKEVKSLSGLLPMCANCKKIRDDQGYWQQVEEYISAHSEADFSHGICPECIRILYPELRK